MFGYLQNQDIFAHILLQAFGTTELIELFLFGHPKPPMSPSRTCLSYQACF